MEPVKLVIIKFARERPPKILEGEWERQGGLTGFLNHMRTTQHPGLKAWKNASS